ncbi:hypothetical protein ASPZODRAFT_14206 [Penicilliopsis zonata CBS 506.65]|uniref:MYND-type domain-containing protein n=1 Tax=Penicilliopsis zonata CBS 506.65 TaxID=1073090 RepID=A0A1L9SQJ4_9EURO|nr:hypothetical protein ASPZODRAFT_14206 [Penicilliopsis zonata CBS 506.65]OJJ49490.1 hypothetical protein ASPZODRAFT_14206 [Penicilliopsis zonata CBS 506.65]
MASSSSKTGLLVRQFNALPRPTPTATMKNHYIFTVMPLPLGMKGDMRHSEGRARILTLPSVEEQAKVIVPLLLEAFVTAFDYELPVATAPGSWSTTDDKLAEAVSRRLGALGVRRELQDVGTMTSEADLALVEKGFASWSRSFEMFAPMMPDQNVQNADRACATCGFSPSVDSELKRCARCKARYYCSVNCQKGDWPTHKQSCRAP